MELNKYQKIARTTAVYKEPKIIYPALGLAGEAGEVAEQVKKFLRDDNGIMTEERRNKIRDEVSDVLWYIANLLADLNLTMNEVAERNIEKLMDRKARGVIKGSGSNR